MLTLAERQKEYETAYDTKIIRRLPLIIRIDGKGFSRLTRQLPLPYCSKFMGLMTATMLDTVKEIEGAIFAYQQSDEISFVLRNDNTLDTEPWFGNRVQKIVSTSAALATSFFKDNLDAMKNPPELIGRAVFDARIFAVPSISEVVNNLLFRQQDCMRNALSTVARTELSKKFGRKTASSILRGKRQDTQKELLKQECDIDFDVDYPAAYRHGVAAYKITRFVSLPDGNQVARQRWAVDTNTPKFNDDRDFILSILNFGKDIFRERDIDV